MFLNSSPQHRTRAELVKEAQDCRRYAVELADRPEESLLLRIADAFDELARAESSRAQ